MAAKRIMLMRHGEKPSLDGAVVGVDSNGRPSADELSVRGWQRAGALVRFFSPRPGQTSTPGISLPSAIFAPAVSGSVTSVRAQHTVAPLAKSLGMDVRLHFRKGEEVQLAAELLTMGDTILVCWEHHAIPRIANALLGDDTTGPQSWPDDRFDLVWTLDEADAKFSLSEVSQLLLPGDQGAAL